MWEDPNNNNRSYLYLKAVHLSTTIVVTVGVHGSNLYRAMLFNFSVLCTCHSPLWGPFHRWLQSPPICLRWQTGITNHNHTQKSGWEDNGGQIRGSGGDESPLNRGKERKRQREHFIHSFITQTLSQLRLSTWFNRKQVVTFWWKGYFGAIENPNPRHDKEVYLKKLLHNLKGLLFRRVWFEARNPLLLGWECEPAPWWSLMVVKWQGWGYVKTVDSLASWKRNKLH